MPYVRISLMVCSFSLVVYMMHFMSSTKLEETSFGEVMGLPKKQKPVEWDWCSEQLEKLQITELESGKSLSIINSLDKKPEFLSKHCKLKLWKIDNTKLKRLSHKMTIRYKDNKKLDLRFSKAGSLMGWGDKTYYVDGFMDAIEKQFNEIRK